MTSSLPDKAPLWEIEFTNSLILEDAEKYIRSKYPLEKDWKRLLEEMRSDLGVTMPRTPEAVLDWPPQASDVPGIAHALRRQGRRLSYLAKIDEGRRKIQIYRIIVA
ncbi:MAG TPA: hypothetical protein VK914_02530 [bacterium]|jgi:hypothetical protein|nr:hypothetical protein [bacterium]